MFWEFSWLWEASDMASLLRMVEACLLCFMGTFMLMLATSAEYWRFIHPKYAWISLTAGACITILGIASLFNRSKKANFSELACIALFCIIAYAATALPTPFGGTDVQQQIAQQPVVPAQQNTAAEQQNSELADLGPEEPPVSFSGLPEPTEEEQSPRLTLHGKEYVKINQAELIVLDGDHHAKPGDRFVIQGAVVRTKQLDALGTIAVARLLITCCFADATATAYLVKVADPQKYENNEWVRAAGTIQPVDEALLHITLPVPGAITTVVGENFQMQADDIKVSEPTGLPFLFQVKTEEPYAY